MRKKQSGFTLIEVLISVVVLSTGLLILYRPLMASLTALDYADTVLQGDRLIKSSLWDIRESIRQTGSVPAVLPEKQVLLGKRPAAYRADLKPLTPDGQLLRLDLFLGWKAFGSQKRLLRQTYLYLPKLSQEVARG